MFLRTKTVKHVGCLRWFCKSQRVFEYKKGDDRVCFDGKSVQFGSGHILFSKINSDVTVLIQLCIESA